MPYFKTDQALWYNNGIWGELGYAVPNFGNDPATLNAGIHYLVAVMGRNLSAIMHHPDADSREPPRIKTLTRVHKLITRARSIMAGRDVEPNEGEMEAIHSSPASQDFVIFPVPYFRVRNPWLKEWCGLTLNALCEAMQHTENRRPYDFSTAFSGAVGQYLHRVYRLMATELFGVPSDEAKLPTFTLTDEMLGTYDPGKYFTQTEMIDTVPRIELVPTEDDLECLTNGIPATLLVNLQKYPSGQMVNEVPPAMTAAASANAGNTEAGVAAFRPPPAV